MVKERLLIDDWKPLTAMLALVEHAARDRNFLLHTPIHVSDEYPVFLVAGPLTDDSYLLDDTILSEGLEAVRKARNAVQSTHNEARKLLSAGQPRS